MCCTTQEQTLRANNSRLDEGQTLKTKLHTVWNLYRLELYKSYSFDNISTSFLPIACSCDSIGSSSLQCVDSTGTCTCNAGYQGTKCDTACGCDTTGSSSTACNQMTGQCTCKTGYTGITCKSCDTNYFNASDGKTCTGKFF